MEKCGIYIIKNIANGKVYVGQSIDLDYRRRLHFHCLKHGHHFNPHLQSAYFEYGLGNFEWRILEEVPEDLLDAREKSWISFYKSLDRKFGYNLESGGHVIKHHADESRRKMSASIRSKVRTAAQKNSISNLHEMRRGTHPSTETRLKMSLARMGHSVSSETRQKIADTQRGRVFSNEHRKKISLAQKGIPRPRHKLYLDISPVPPQPLHTP